MAVTSRAAPQKRGGGTRSGGCGAVESVGSPALSGADTRATVSPDVCARDLPGDAYIKSVSESDAPRDVRVEHAPERNGHAPNLPNDRRKG